MLRRRIAPTAVKQRPRRRRPWAEAVKWQPRAAVQQSDTSVAEKPRSPPASQGWTPLLLAAQGGHTEIAEALMARGADVKAENVSGRGREPWRRMGGQAAGQNHVRQQATRGGAAE